MFEVLRADPCRFVETILDFRSLRRILRAWRRRGTKAILDEISTSEEMTSLTLPSFESLPAEDDDVTKTLLVIDAAIPQYDRDAGARSSFLYLQLLREMGHEVFFMPNDQLRREPYASILEAMGVQLLLGRGFRCGGWKRWLATQAGQISHIILHRPNVARRYLDGIKRYCSAKIIYFAHDLRFLRERRHFEVKGDEFHYGEANYWESIERGILARVDLAYFFSDQEVRTVSEWGLNCNKSSIPLFPVVLNSYSGPPFEQRAGLLFVGGFAHQPNLDAVLWFANEVFPHIRHALPDIEWHIVGREPPPAVRSLAGLGVIVEGAVSESRLEKLYQSTRVVIAPLRFGAGVKGKVVEAMCQGVPVVTTPVGAEGIPGADDALCVTHSAEDMARHIVALYQDLTAWESARDRMAQFSKLRFSRTAAVHQLTEGLWQSPVNRAS